MYLISDKIRQSRILEDAAVIISSGSIINYMKNNTTLSKNKTETVDAQYKLLYTICCLIPLTSSSYTQKIDYVCSARVHVAIRRAAVWNKLDPTSEHFFSLFPSTAFQGEFSHVPTSPMWHLNMFSLHLGSRPPRAHLNTQ